MLQGGMFGSGHNLYKVEKLNGDILKLGYTLERIFKLSHCIRDVRSSFHSTYFIVIIIIVVVASVDFYSDLVLGGCRGYVD